MEQKYITYLDSAIKRKGSTYEETFIYCFDNAINARYRHNNISEHNYVNIACILLENINLNFVIKNDAKTITLKDKIALDSSIFHVDHEIINKFLSLNPGMYFKNSCYGVTSDICQLNFIVGNNEEGKKIFNSNDYQLYSLQQYNALKNSKYYDTKKYGQPIDSLAVIVISAEKTILLQLLYSDKIKMIGAEYLHIITNRLGDEEYLRFMDHVKQNNILISVEDKMARIVGVDLPNEKRVEIGLTYIYGVGRVTANKILEATGINPDTRVRDLTEAETGKIREYIDKNLVVEGDLKREVGMNIKALQEIGSYRGIRHRKGLPVRGQSTKSNARTRKGPRSSSVKKK